MTDEDGRLDRGAIKALKEKRANLWNEQKALLDEVGEGSWSAEQDAKWARMESDMAAFNKTIERAEGHLRADAVDAAHAGEQVEKTGMSRDEYDAVFRTYLKAGISALDGTQRNILAGNLLTDNSIKNALGVATGAAGGYTVPEGFWNRVSETLKAFGGVAQVANVITTEDGRDLPWMTNDDTGNEGAILGENTAIGELDVTFGTRTLGAFLYTSKLVRVSYQLLQDSAIDVEAFLARKFAMRLARIHNRHETTGTGTGQPLGIVTGATAATLSSGNAYTASATAITFEEIIDLVHSVDPAYRGQNARFMFADAVLANLRKVRDDSGASAGTGAPLWQPSVQVGEPSTIYGYPYVVNQHMASVAGGNTSVLFGDLYDGYVIRRVRNAQLVRLDERYAEYLQVGFFMFDREDATTDDTSAYRALVQHA